jgi:hypothetical protein
VGRQLHLIPSFDQRVKSGESIGWWTNDQPQSPFSPDVDVGTAGPPWLIVGCLQIIDVG